MSENAAFKSYLSEMTCTVCDLPYDECKGGADGGDGSHMWCHDHDEPACISGECAKCFDDYAEADRQAAEREAQIKPQLAALNLEPLLEGQARISLYRLIASEELESKYDFTLWVMPEAEDLRPGECSVEQVQAWGNHQAPYPHRH